MGSSSDFAASSEHLKIRVRSILARPSRTSVFSHSASGDGQNRWWFVATNRPGPQLLRRGAQSASSPGGTNANQQSVVLLDNDPSGQPVKTGDHDKKEAIQQSLTAAAGVYGRLGPVDRH